MIEWLGSFLQWFFIVYVLCMNFGYLLLNISSLFSISKYMQKSDFESFVGISADFMPPISILVPAFNEENTIETTVRSLLQLDYPQFEVLVINDGSKDSTLQTLITAFDFQPFPEAYRVRVPIKQPIKRMYCSAEHINLRIVDKENGGKADSLNAGINACRYPLFCCVDADSILQRESLKRVVKPFMEDPRTVASGGTVRIANGCTVKEGFLVNVSLPSNLLALVQIVEYLRSFLFGRLGWSPFNALLIISGAFGVFHKETVIAAGAYRPDTIGEDMELVVRLHRHLRLTGKPYRITFVPDPVCFTEAPEDVKVLRNQRIRWQQGLSESLSANMDLLFNRRAGVVGWFAFPFMVIFEWMGPIIEFSGYLFMIVGFMFDIISLQGFMAFFILSVSLSMFISVTALMLEEMSFHVYKGVKTILLLFLVALVENLGYRQLNSYWRLIGLYRWARGKEGRWGDMNRSGSWGQNQTIVNKKVPGNLAR